jgi:hypothetical protein
MASFIRDRITLVWLGLVLATCLSWETGSDLAFAGDIRSLGGVVLVIAFIKVRYVMLEFMELRHAPLVMRLFAEGWCVLVCAAVITFYWGAAIS